MRAALLRPVSTAGLLLTALASFGHAAEVKPKARRYPTYLEQLGIKYPTLEPGVTAKR